MREIKYFFDWIITNIGVKNVVTNYMPLEVNKSILLWCSNSLVVLEARVQFWWTRPS